MMPERDTSEAVVIGGGVIGCAVLRELARRGIEALLVEAEPDVAEGASKANSAIIHTGFDAKPGTIEAALLRRSAERWPELLDELAVPSLECGALMLARTTEDAGRLAGMAETATAHGVVTEIVDRSWLDDAAPYVHPETVAALHIPGEAIVDPFWLTRAYGEAAIGLGARIWTDARVRRLEVGLEHVDIGLVDGRSIRAGQVFDCAGLWADDVAALAGDVSFGLTPRKGQFLVSERTYDVDRIVLPIPGPLGKGMLVTPIVFGGLLLGPTAEDGADKGDRSTTDAGRSAILAACRSLVPDVQRMDPIRSFAGVRAVSSTGDYILRPSSAGDRLTIVAGIRSTGISASPGIAEAAVELASAARGWARRPPSGPAVDPGLSLAAEAGAIVCVCRSVGSAEVDAALLGSLPATTTDGLKRRSGVGFGDCQGGRCLAEAVFRVAEARGCEPTVVEKGLTGSWIVTSIDAGAAGTPRGVEDRVAASPGADLEPRPTEPDEPDASDEADASDAGSFDVAIVGGGAAGIGAAIAASDAGARVVVVDRGGRPGGALLAIGATAWTADELAAITAIHGRIAAGSVGWRASATVVGLALDDRGWLLEIAQDPRGATTGSDLVRARAVVLATGGYVTPREHRAIGGSRPSGVMSADFALDALERGWLPARRAVVVGSGRLARAVRERLVAAGGELVVTRQCPAGAPGAAGAAVVSGAAGVTEIRGDRRLEAVRVDGQWIAADGLILADALRPASFLLRGLGIGDDRPGVPMPARSDGALELAGLWAAGTCVEPDIEHARSLEHGGLVGRSAASSVGAAGGVVTR